MFYLLPNLIPIQDIAKKQWKPSVNIKLLAIRLDQVLLGRSILLSISAIKKLHSKFKNPMLKIHNCTTKLKSYNFLMAMEKQTIGESSKYHFIHSGLWILYRRLGKHHGHETIRKLSWVTFQAIRKVLSLENHRNDRSSNPWQNLIHSLSGVSAQRHKAW